MKNYILHDPWLIIEKGFDPELNRISESLCSLGNGHMGQRANFEEKYSGDTHQGTYVGGVYYPDKTRVGWWKNGYPEYFAKVLNAPSWIGIHISIEGTELDLHEAKVNDFERVLDMKEGVLRRSFTATLKDGKEVKVKAERFCSMADGEIGAIKYAITPLNFSAEAKITLAVDADVVNLDSNYDEKFWEEIAKHAEEKFVWVNAATRKTDFHVCTGITYQISQNGNKAEIKISTQQKEKYADNIISTHLKQGEETTIYKYAAVLSSMNHDKAKLQDNCMAKLMSLSNTRYEVLYEAHQAVWAHQWEEADILIEGDVAAQQGIRFNIFQLLQTYTGKDERLNIGPKGFTGEKYGGSTYWDTEAYCLPFYLSVSEQKVPRNLLVYRYKHLQRAIENAQKLGFTDGAALYPMVTMNGEECHNEWEITFEEIHRNGAIAFAIYDYIRYTGDEHYLAEYGLEVLIGISRFWSQRVNWSDDKKKFVMLGVTGPNEYENNVNNNWYTNTIAVWCLKYTKEAIDWVKNHDADAAQKITSKVNLSEAELKRWGEIAANMYFSFDEQRQVFLQQDGFLDKELIHVKDLRKEDRPLNQKWSWDRILRSCFIKQADVLQGLYLLEDQYDKETIQRNFDFYEPMTVHESSLSPCVHVILASKLGYEEKAYEMYLRTSRLDLDDYNNDTEDGCHITSMAGTWMAVVKGFGGMRVSEGQLHFNPFIPKEWQSYTFKIKFRGRVLQLFVDKSGAKLNLQSGEPLTVVLGNEEVQLS